MSRAPTMPSRAPRWRPLLYALAVFFAVATISYSALWLYYIRHLVRAEIGINFKYSLAARAIEITRVLEGRAAQRAGLRPGDQIVAINGLPLVKITPYYDLIDHGRPDDIVTLAVRKPGSTSPDAVRIMLDHPSPYDFLSPSSPVRRFIFQIMGLYPVPFLVVGLAVLFLRISDRNVWLLAFLFAGFIASAGMPEGAVRPPLRELALSYQSVFRHFCPALFYCFFAVFPAPSPLERRAPWLKWVFVVSGAVLAILGLWTVRVAGGLGGFGLEIDLTSNGTLTAALSAFSFAYQLGGEGLGIVSLLLNSYGTATNEARQKARVIVWGVLGGLLPMLMLILVVVLFRLSVEKVPFWPWAITALSLFLIPLSFAYAVVKHRVMEIPVLLKRSVRYVLVQRGFAFLAVIWGWGITGLFISVTLRLPSLFPWDPHFTLWAVVGTAVSFGSLLAAAGARLHEQATRKIDRAFFRSAYDARQILLELAEEARSAVERRQLAILIEREVRAALHPKTLAVYFETSPGLLALQGGSGEPAPITLSVEAPLLTELGRRGKPWDAPPLTQSEASGILGPLQPECLVPLKGLRDDRLLGLLVLGPRLSEEPYSGEDKRLLASVASQVAISLENFGLAEQMAERLQAERRRERDMEIAKQVQARLFPQHVPQLATLDYQGGCVQAREVGGDYYDFLDLAPGRVGLVLADISGKGISGALLMANLQANLRSQYAVALEDLPRLLGSVNRLFCQNTGDSSFATLFFADYDDATRRLRYVNCGHNPPYVIRACGQVERLCATATVLGLFSDWRCEVKEAQIAAGDLLVLYTDGVTEAMSDEGEEFGEERFLDALLAHRHLPVGELLNALVATTARFSGREQEDDITLVVGRAR